MKYFTIHSVCEEIFNLDLKNYVLTFDDALYSQFYYWELINRLENDKILFIPTGAIILSDYVRKRFNSEFINFVDCFEALSQWKMNDNREHYMTLGEVKFLIKRYNIRIGGHGYNHTHPDCYGVSLSERTTKMKQDVDSMFNWFERYLYIKPVDFCFPFNKEDSFLKLILKDKGIENFYGGEREEIEILCQNL